MATQNKKAKAAGTPTPPKKKSSGLGALFALLILVLPRLMSAVENGGSGNFGRYLRCLFYRWSFQTGIDPSVLGAIAAGLLILAVILLIAAAAGKAVRRQTDRSVVGRAGGRTSAAVQRPDPRSRSFTPPTPTCIVCDHTGEDHFLRDKARRIAQLDDWLKSGIIDREEFRVLKDRYERDL